MQNVSTQNLFTGSTKLTNTDARNHNLKAISAVKNSIMTSFGALGLDKMCIDSTGEVLITNDGATIIQTMDIVDPAAKILAEIAMQQDIEVGDGTTTVVLLAASLIEKGIKLINQGLHPSVIVNGYKMVYKEALNFIKNTMEQDSKNIKSIIETTISSKVINVEKELFGDILYNAVKNIEDVDFNGNNIYRIENINILKKQGGSIADSNLINGYAINALPSNLMVKKVEKPKIICIDFDLNKVRLPLGVNVTVSDPDKLEEIRKKETTLTLERVDKIIKSGATVVLSSRGIDDICAKPFVDAGMIAIKRVDASELKALAKGLDIPIVTSLSDLEGKDVINTIGNADSIVIESIGDSECTVVYASEKKLSSIILRGPNEQVIEEMDRSVHDGLCVIKRVMETGKVLPGGGAFESSLAIHLEELSTTISSKEGVVVFYFSEALLEIPRILMQNAGLDSNELLSKLLFYHQEGKKKKEKDHYLFGIDLYTGEIQNNIANGIIEPSLVKIKALRSAVEAAISILRIDEIIYVPEEKKEERPQC
ncbi:T-complex protein 1 subunit alpha [Spraguea lophii 42_110]|uniref:T-complex protein 1 subunit alpha n=1 Tax=Spraguea lophii (strain 42_110) TaxID=1358809 RepID=S7WAS5_SPRLO|nr:T-complex protein 1 subunit alpha [Spraguea lophii 42_110]